MKKIRKHIEIVCSTKTGLNSMSRESRDAVLAVLSDRYSHVRITIANSLDDLDAVATRQPDLVFLGVKAIPLPADPIEGPIGRVWVSDYLEERGIPCTGSSSNAHVLEMNKHLAKRRVRDAGLATAPYCVLKRDRTCLTDRLSRLNFPLFVKPINRGGGEGIDSSSVVRTLEELWAKHRMISTAYGADSLVEEYLPGREFSVAILKDRKTAEYSALPVEMIAEPDGTGASFLGKAIKTANSERVLAVPDSGLKSAVCSLALGAFHALGGRDYGRIDIRLDREGRPQFLEANLIPSIIAGYGSFPKSCELNLDLGYEAMVLRIARLAAARGLGLEQANEELAPSPGI